MTTPRTVFEISDPDNLIYKAERFPGLYPEE